MSWFRNWRRRKSQPAQRGRPRANRLVPSLESLEERAVPVVGWVDANNVLNLVAPGDRSLVILDNGTCEPGDIRVQWADSNSWNNLVWVYKVANGGGMLVPLNSLYVSDIQFTAVNTGSQSVVYSLYASPLEAGVSRLVEGRFSEPSSANPIFQAYVAGLDQNASLNINVNGDDGCDTLHAAVWGALRSGSHLGIQFNGEGGWNSIWVDAASAPLTIEAGATFWANLCGNDYASVNTARDPGNDIALDYSGLMNGNIQFNIQGGGGQEWLAAHLSFWSGSHGTVGSGSSNGRAALTSGDGTDQMDYLLWGDPSAVRLLNPSVTSLAFASTTLNYTASWFPGTSDFRDVTHLNPL
jgi:hypothetical protein